MPNYLEHLKDHNQPVINQNQDQWKLPDYFNPMNNNHWLEFLPIWFNSNSFFVLLHNTDTLKMWNARNVKETKHWPSPPIISPQINYFPGIKITIQLQGDQQRKVITKEYISFIKRTATPIVLQKVHSPNLSPPALYRKTGSVYHSWAS